MIKHTHIVNVLIVRNYMELMLEDEEEKFIAYITSVPVTIPQIGDPFDIDLTEPMEITR